MEKKSNTIARQKVKKGPREEGLLYQAIDLAYLSKVICSILL
jgi:hypothetical protein